MGANLRSLAIWVLILSLSAAPHMAAAREDYIPHALIQILVYDDHLLNPFAYGFGLGPTVFLQSSDIQGKKLIIRFDFQDKKISYLHDENLPNDIPAFAENSSHIFAGGDGLAAFDKKTKTWVSWSEFKEDTIFDIVANDSLIWLATKRGAVQVRLNDRAVVKRYSRSTGLNSDKVYSLFATKEILLAGTFWNGRDIKELNLARREDIFGSGLTQIDLRSGATEEIELPAWVSEDVPGVKGLLVLDMYKVAGKENTIKIVTWKPWETKCWDFNYSTKNFAESESQLHQLDRILNLYQAEAASSLASKLIDYIVTFGLDRWGGGLFEIMKLIYDREDFRLVESLLNDENPRVRGDAVRGISPIDDARVTEYLLEALKDEDRYALTWAIKALVDRKERRSIEPLKNLLTTKDRGKHLRALGALLEFDDPIIRDIMVGEDDSLKSALGTIFSHRRGRTVGGYLGKIAMAADEPLLLRRAAISYIDGEHGCRFCTDGVFGNEPLLRFLNSVIRNENEDEIIRRHAQSIIAKVKKRSR